MCSVVGCHGRVYFLAARSYGRQWLTLLSSDDLRASLAEAAPPANAVSLDLIRAPAPRLRADTERRCDARPWRGGAGRRRYSGCPGCRRGRISLRWGERSGGEECV